MLNTRIFLIGVLTLTVGCASTVPKAEFDALQVKFDDLNKDTEKMVEQYNTQAKNMYRLAQKIKDLDMLYNLEKQSWFYSRGFPEEAYKIEAEDKLLSKEFHIKYKKYIPEDARIIDASDVE